VAAAEDDVESGLRGFEEPRYRLRRILEITVEHDHPPALGDLEAYH
jgi:hypothetical protein